METFPSRCLLCLVKVEREVNSNINANVVEQLSPPDFQLESEVRVEANQESVNQTEVVNSPKNTKPKSLLQRQLDVIFLLRKVLKIPSSQLRRFLKVRGNPGGWVVLCGSCEDLVRSVKEVFFQLQKISRKYDDARMKVEEWIRCTSLMNEVETGSDFILDECRKIICNRNPSSSANICYLEGDRKAQELLQNVQKHRHPQVQDVEGDETFQDIQDLLDLDKTLPHITNPFESLERLDEVEILNPSEETDQKDPLSVCCATLDDHQSEASSVSYIPPDSCSLVSSVDDLKDSEHEEDTEDELDKEEVKTRHERKPRQRSSDKPNCESTSSPKKRKVEEETQVHTSSNSADPRRRYKCSICRPKEPVTFTHLLDHIHRIHHFSYKCTHCSHGFKTMDPHPINNHYHCRHKDLKGTIPFISRFEALETPELPTIPWSCPSCFQEFLEENVRDNHILKDHGNQVEVGRILKCDHCPKSYFTEEERYAHILLLHPVFFKKSQFQCDECLQSLGTVRTLRAHRIQIHNLDLYKCKHCSREFKDDRNFMKHVRHKHGDPKEVPRSCKTCNQKFPNEEEYTSHMNLYHNVDAEKLRLTCHLCQKVLKNKYGLNLHLFKMHGVRAGRGSFKSYTCTFEGCDKVFFEKRALNQHLEVHEIGGKLQCAICKKEFNSQRTLDNHELLVHRIVKPSTQNRTVYECDKCGQRYNNEKYLKSHFEICKGKKDGPTECDLCFAKCASSKDLRIHKKFKHSIIIPEEKEPEEEGIVGPDTEANAALKDSSPCPHCGKIIVGEERLDQHLKNVHQKDKELRFICTICPDQKFSGQTYLDCHMARYHDVGTENFKCFQCGKFCKTKALRRRHVCGVKDVPTRVCDLCGVECRDRGELRRHIAHKHENQMNVSCDLCDYRTTLQSYLRRHKATHHGIGIKCQVEECHRFFVTEKELEQHMKKIHPHGERERSFLCTECGKGFFHERALKLHLQAMHLNKDSKPYKCKLRGKGFATASYRCGHMKTHRKQEVKAEVTHSIDDLNIL